MAKLYKKLTLLLRNILQINQLSFNLQGLQWQILMQLIFYCDNSLNQVEFKINILRRFQHLSKSINRIAKWPSFYQLRRHRRRNASAAAETTSTTAAKTFSSARTACWPATATTATTVTTQTPSRATMSQRYQSPFLRPNCFFRCVKQQQT